MPDLYIEDKKSEIHRIQETIGSQLYPLIKDYIPEDRTQTTDFSQLMEYIQRHKKRLDQHIQGFKKFTNGDICKIRRIRNVCAHNLETTPDELSEGITRLISLRNFFGIKPITVQLRILSCKSCKTIITRTAQPTTIKSDLSNNIINITRTQEVQPFSLMYNTREAASCENKWYDSWAWSRVLCSTCYKAGLHQELGYRFDWAPEELLQSGKITYSLERQTMIVTTEDQITDLTHLVSDGTMRHHHYAFIEERLSE